MGNPWKGLKGMKNWNILYVDGTVMLSGHLDRRSAAKDGVQTTRNGSCLSFSSEGTQADDVLEDCIILGDAHWYGGPEQYRQYWPLDNVKFDSYSFVTKSQDSQGIAEPYWLSSTGLYINVEPNIPLFIDMNHNVNNTLCFIAKSSLPYPTTQNPSLKYSICSFDDAKQAHMHAIETVFGKPEGYPDERMIRHPIWSTWARYKREVNEATVLQFADEILAYGFENSQLEIDDDWEQCYGALTFDEYKFANPKNLTDTLKAKGFRVTLWIHPFVNFNCNPWYTDAGSRSYLVYNDTGNNTMTTWWDGFGGIVDFTNTQATQWFVDRLKSLQEQAGIDSFKFDAGETSWMPQPPRLNSSLYEAPGIYTNRYVNVVSQFGPMIEVRTGLRTQNLPVFVRMLDKDSNWSWNNGLKTLVTTLLQMNLVGYPFVLPDMIGGNGYSGGPSKELFIRWMQANVFMPTLQYSYVPWDFDNETVEICKKYTKLHADFANTIIELAQKAVQDGTPINPPIWWIDPSDETAQTINSGVLGANKEVMKYANMKRNTLAPKVWVGGSNQRQNVWTPKKDKAPKSKNTFACLLAATQALPTSTSSFVVTPASEGNFLTITKPDGTIALTGHLGRHSQNVDYKMSRAGSCLLVTATTNVSEGIIKDCFDLGSAHWYGGAEQFQQYWPLEEAHFEDYSYVTKQQDNQGIAEPYWLSSTGVYIHVDDGVPLFIDLNHEYNNTLCLSAKSVAPYPPHLPSLNYSLCSFDDAREAHKHAIETVLGKPSGFPDELMIRSPIWSTWARYKADINETLVLQFADEILQHNYPNSQLEVDDDWEVCYGALTFDTTKFPNMKGLTDTLREKGFRVTLWVHPFINLDCEPWHSEAQEKGYFVKNQDGNTTGSWWNGIASAIDFTNPEAVEWYSSRLRAMQEENGIDSLKFDAGETSWLPQIPVLSADIDLQPSIYTNAYVNAVSKFGPMIEVRVAQRSQNLPMFVRMLDKDTNWGWTNGLKTLVTTLLQMNMVGYPLVLPDMIAGNGYAGVFPSKELFIRWLQANVFMPSIQYSYVPWDFDDETVALSLEYTLLHAQYADKIVELFNKAVQDGSPVNPPIWWIDPTDEVAQTIDSEYLLGEEILVAPILDEGATSRDIYLPRGEWRDELRSETITGPVWLRDYQANLHELPYFTRVSA
ncbi:hypothetical protein C0J52_14633 [Blattella germanica]|nr:hypothetical protein C0J52_14633 [Blattella germanica]